MPKIDLVTWGCVVVLVSLGILLIIPYSSDLARQQLVFGLLGLLITLIVSRTDYRIFQTLGIYFYLFAILILVSLRLFGEEVRGSIRWFNFGRWQLQPSELLKPALIIAFAQLIDQAHLLQLRSLVKLIIFVLVPVVLVFWQPDLGNTLIYLVVVSIMVTVAGLPLRLFALGITSVILILPPSWHLLHSYQRQRVLSFINPDLDPLGSGYQTMQSLIAVGSGGVFGKGIGKGTQSRLQFLPEQHNDFIFATLAEETGFIGASLVLLIFSIFIWRIIKVADSAPDRFSSLLVSGLVAQFLFQMLINTGMNLGIMPVTGVTFPFLSYGGSSLIGSLIGIGLIISVSRQTRAGQTIDIGRID